MWKCILIGWAIFDAVVYLLMWFDDLFYAHDLPRTLKTLKQTLTEE